MDWSALRQCNPKSYEIANQAIQLTVAWPFLFPLLESEAIAKHLEDCWPAFVLDTKDAFIALVVDGPFPLDLVQPFP
jgi:hypothetical protein